MSIQESINRVVGEVQTQTNLISQIKTVLADKAAGGGGAELPPLDDAVRASASDMAVGKQLYDDDGNLVEGNLPVWNSINWSTPTAIFNDEEKKLTLRGDTGERKILNEGSSNATMHCAGNKLGNATIEDVRAGVTFTSENGLKLTGIASMSSGESYTGDLYSYSTATAKPGSGATSVQFTGIPKEPDFFVCYVDTFNAEQWKRVGVVAYDGEMVYGHEVASGTNEVTFYENTNDASDYHWRFSYSGTTLTISSASTSKGGYFHNPGTYTLLYAYKDNENGTVAIEKSRIESYSSYGFSASGDRALKGEPVWYSAVFHYPVDAQGYSQNTMVFANEKGYTTISNGSTSSYTFNASTTHDNYSDGELRIKPNNAAPPDDYSDVRFFYAYEPKISATVDTSDANVSPNQMLAGASAYAKGKLVEGNIQSRQAQTITPSTTTQYIEPGVYLAGRQTISAIQTQSKTATSNGTVTPDSGMYLSSVVVNVPTSGGVTLPTLTDPAYETDVAEGKEYIDADGVKRAGSVMTFEEQAAWNNITPTQSGDTVRLSASTNTPYLFKKGVYVSTPLSNFGNAQKGDVRSGVTFTSSAGLVETGGASIGIEPSGTMDITSNGTYDVSSYASANVKVQGVGGAQVGSAYTSTFGSDSLSFSGLQGSPKMFVIMAVNSFNVTNTNLYITSVCYNGTELQGMAVARTQMGSNYRAACQFVGSALSWTYSNGTLTISSSSSTTGGQFYSSTNYYIYYAY